MKSKFRGYYRPTEEEFSKMWQDCLFVFDANVLLSLFRLDDASANEIISVLQDQLDRIWIPYRAAYEYHNNLLNVIKEQERYYGNALEQTKKVRLLFTQEDERHPYLPDDLQKEFFEILDKVDSALSDKKKEISSWIPENALTSKIATIFEGKVGDTYDSERLEQIYKDGEQRYEKEIPPGYKDKKKDSIDGQYGDLVIWFQILDKMKDSQKGVIFVTNDNKEDWFRRQGDQMLGPRPELIAEAKEIGVYPFYIYTLNNFLKYAKEYLGAKIDDNTIEEVEQNLNAPVGIRTSLPFTSALAAMQKNPFANMSVLAAMQKNSFANMSVLAAMQKNPFANMSVLAAMQKNSFANMSVLAAMRDNPFAELSVLTELQNQISTTSDQNDPAAMSEESDDAGDSG